MNTANLEMEIHQLFYSFRENSKQRMTFNKKIHAVINNDNFLPGISSYLKKFANFTKEIKDKGEAKQVYKNKYTDFKR